jgi:hypothetical protein
MHDRKNHRRAAICSGAAFALALGLVACGDDDDAGTATGSTSAACSSLVAFDAAASGDSDTSTPEAAKALGAQLAPLWDAASGAVPDAVGSDADAVAKAIDDLAAGDDAAFSADDTFNSYTNVLSAAVDRCGFAQQAAKAEESGGTYRFEGMPDSLDPGVIALSLTNDGSEPHVMVVYRKNDGETRSAEELLALPEDEGQAAGQEVGGVFALPGSSSVGLVSLTPGDYVYFCPIPIGGADDAPPHFTQGMYGEFTVG